MPQKFVHCYKTGGRVRTVHKGGKSILICFQGGKSYAGEAKRTAHKIHKTIHKKGR